jgi:hypothetical protein
VNREIPIRFAPRQPPPPGYRVEWWEQDEHYHWATGKTYSDIFATRWQAWHAAWEDCRAAAAGE